MKKICLMMFFLSILPAFGAEKAAKELYQERTGEQLARNELNAHNPEIHIGEKDMEQGVRCYYLQDGRNTASDSKNLYCLKI